jgi:bacillithiol biosynthesis cysteine-adding enzyme BshC
VEEGGAVVTTGQQAGLFTGPLYTIYKALSAVFLARKLEAELGVIVLPVFWVASEDHDWAEVSHAYVVGDADELRRIELPGEAKLALPMSERRLGDEVRNALEELRQAAAGFAGGGSDLKCFVDAYRPDETVAGAFRRVMEELFAPFDLLTTDAADPHLKQRSIPVLRQAIDASARHEAVLGERTSELQEAGYHAQVPILSDAANVFYHGPLGRERLYRRAGRLVARDAGLVFDEPDLLAELEADPSRFSPNVLLRPVVESYVFPTLSYVAGPGEASYFAQLGPLFREYGIGAPVVFPRFSVTLVEERIERVREKLGLSLMELRGPRHELATRLARGTLPEGVERALDRLKHTLVDGYRELMEAGSAVDPTLTGPLGALRNASLADLADGERKILSHWKDRNTVLLEQLDRVRAHLAPNGEPQERVLNIAPYLARYGTGLLSAVAAEMRIEWKNGDRR